MIFKVKKIFYKVRKLIFLIFYINKNNSTFFNNNNNNKSYVKSINEMKTFVS